MASHFCWIFIISGGVSVRIVEIEAGDADAGRTGVVLCPFIMQMLIHEVEIVNYLFE